MISCVVWASCGLRKLELMLASRFVANFLYIVWSYSVLYTRNFGPYKHLGPCSLSEARAQRYFFLSPKPAPCHRQHTAAERSVGPPLALWRTVRRWREYYCCFPHYEIHDQQVCIYRLFLCSFKVRIPGGSTVRCPLFALICCLKYDNIQQCAPCLVTIHFRRIFTLVWYWRTIWDVAEYFSRVRKITKSD